jgi:hypothetical protein
VSQNFTLPKNTRLFSTAEIFSGAFNVPTLGKYDFTIPVNQGRPLLSMTNSALYYLDRILLGGTIAEGDFLSSIDGTTAETLPRFYLSTQQTNLKVFGKDFPFISFQNFETSVFFDSMQSRDTLLLTVQGRLDQIAATVGIVNIKLRVSCLIYEITDGHFIKNYRDRTESGFGDFLRK